MKHLKCIPIAGYVAFLLAVTISCKKNIAESSTTSLNKKDKNQSSVSEVLPIIAVSNPRLTTNKLASGSSGFEIGINSNAGGIINRIFIPGIGDIMDEEADPYGRAGQVAIRDASHGGRYNPTQAGFNETLGSPCIVNVSVDGKTLIIPRRPMALWHGDGQYDFTRWENIGPDPYADGGNTDEDGLNEENLVGKQATEVKSEFDYYGTYADKAGQYGIPGNVGVIRHYYEISFIREPGHCINQHRAGTKLWNANAVQADLSVNAPAGVHPGTDKDMNRMISVWSLRHDIAKWDPGYVYYRKNNGSYGIVPAVGANIDFPADADNTVIINATSTTDTQGKALGIYRPKTGLNTNVILGRNNAGDNVYQDSRDNSVNLLHNPQRIATMSKYGFVSNLRGMINRTRLNNAYEVYRNEVYILYGTPKQIKDAIAKIDLAIF